MLFLVTYDIANCKRLYRVARLLKSFGVRVQRSAFECDLSQPLLEQMVFLLRQTIDPRQDRVHIYRVCESCRPKSSSQGAEIPSDDDFWVV